MVGVFPTFRKSEARTFFPGVDMTKTSFLVVAVLLTGCATAPNDQESKRNTGDYPVVRYIKIDPIENMSWLPLEKRAGIASLLEAGQDGASRSFSDNTYATVLFTDKTQSPVCRNFKYEVKVYTGCRESGTWAVR